MFRALVAVLLVTSFAVAQTPLRPNERPAPPRINPEDKEGIWTLDFTFKNPRTITVDIPGRGKTTVWYLWYEVTNNTGAPRYIHPTFEWVTLDRNTVHVDEVLPSVEAAISKLEDPTGHLKIKNSVTIGKEPIPPSKADAIPTPVYGVAIWPDVATKAANSTRFSIFVSGLSNGWTIDDSGVVRRKTLQLNFKRLADAEHQDVLDIRFIAPTEYVYRSTSVKAETQAKPVSKNGEKPEAKPEEKKEEE